MCFSGTMSGMFAGLGVLAAGTVYGTTGNKMMTVSILFFCLMEALQWIQYFYIADDLKDTQCGNRINQFLTILGYVHIHFQPYFTNLYYQSFRPWNGKAKPGEEKQWQLVGRLCLVSCFLGLLRLVPTTPDPLYYETTKDWLEGPSLCTYRGSYHLAWSLPLAQSSYFIPNMGLHCFLMFVPVLCIGDIWEIDAVAFLFGSGPLLASFVSQNPHESASIWCFFSTIQCAIGAASAIFQASRQKAKVLTTNGLAPTTKAGSLKHL